MITQQTQSLRQNKNRPMSETSWSIWALLL